MAARKKSDVPSRSVYYSDLGLQLVEWDVADGELVQKPAPTHHIFVCDVSGSMTEPLPQMREAIVQKLVKSTRKEDVVSILWFSGTGQHGVLINAQSMSTLTDLSEVQEAVDRWLHPIGLTCFREVIGDASKTIIGLDQKQDKARKTRFAHSLIFLSDGMDNCSRSEDIFAALRELLPLVSAATFVEFGYYADRDMLGRMSSLMGGSLVYARDFARFQPVFDAALKPAKARELVNLSFGLEPVAGCVFGFDGGDLVTFAAQSSGASVSKSTGRVYGLFKYTGPVSSKAEPIHENDEFKALYGLLSILALRGAGDDIKNIHKILGDVRLIRQGEGLFGKQAFERFASQALACAVDKKQRFQLGRDRNALPKDDAFCFLDLIDRMREFDVKIDVDTMDYKGISRAREDATDIGFEKLIFKADAAPNGYSIDGLVYNENRANLSFRVQKPGVVDLSGRMPFKGSVPEAFPTFIYRNYALVADGQVHLEALPIVVGDGSFLKFIPRSYLTEVGAGRYVVSLDSMPILNVLRAGAPMTAKQLFVDQFELERARGAQKVFKWYRDQVVDTPAQPSLQARYGDEAAKWLKAQGLGENGYQPPKTKQVEASDFYMAKVVEVKIVGASSLPKVEQVIAAVEEGRPLKLAEQLMAPAVREAVAMKASLNAADYKVRIIKQTEEAIKAARLGILKIATAKFAMIVTGRWFSDLSTAGSGSLELDMGVGAPVKFSVEAKEEKVEI